MPRPEKNLNGSWRYARPAGAGRCASGFNYTERHLKCVWLSPEWRPAELRAQQGEAVRVEKAGQWNLEKGPDFLNAALLIGPERRRIAGDIEVHVHSADWQRHGHAADPGYSKVIAHVTWFPGHLPPEVLPRKVLQIALQPALSANPCFSFEAIDVTAFPYAVRRPGMPCNRVVAAWPPEKISSLLWTAGRHRLAGKAGRLAEAVKQKGAEQALYEEIMSALGYKHNRLPFRQLAERVPLAMLREESRGDPLAAYALLAGVAGLLPAVTKAGWDTATGKYVRRLWSYWWKLYAKWSARAIPATAWQLSSLRPPNHPRRRLMAAAILFTGQPDRLAEINALPPAASEPWLAQIMRRLLDIRDAYWNGRLAIGRRPAPRDIALLGRARAAAIVSNVIIPFRLARQQPLPPLENLLNYLPAEEDNALIRQAAFNLLGADHNPALYRNGLAQQGLIQIFHDFCLNDRSNCEDCALLKTIAGR